MSYPDDDMYPDVIVITRPAVAQGESQDPATGLSTLTDPDQVIYDGACDAQDVTGKSGGVSFQSDSSNLHSKQADYLVMLPDDVDSQLIELKDSVNITLSSGKKVYGTVSISRDMDNSVEVEKSA